MGNKKQESPQGRTIFALDISLSASGWALVNVKDGVISILDSGEVKTKTNQTHGERLFQIRQELLRLYEKYQPNEIVREAGFARFAAATQALYKAYGVTEELFAEHGVDVPTYAATTIKKEVGGSGKASKEQVEAGVRELLKLPPDFIFKTDNVSDAVAIALTHCLKMNYIQRG